MRFDSFSFGSIRIDGVTCDYDVVIDGGEIRKRKKKQSKQFRDEFWHTPLSAYSPIHRGGHTLEMPAPGSRHRSLWKTAGDEGSEARSGAPQNRIARAPNGPSH
jgi:hypothetical protein